MAIKYINYENFDFKEYRGIEFINKNYVDKFTYNYFESDVIAVKFSDCTLSKIPQGLTKYFPNMRILHIWNSEIQKLSKEDMVEYKKIKGFYCEGNPLASLPGDLFEDFKNLEWISFCDNKLEVIEPNILDGLRKLVYVDFRHNPNYDKFFSTYPSHRDTTSLQVVKTQLSERYLMSCKKNVKKPELDLAQINQKLSVENQKLVQENGKLKDENQKLTAENQTLKNSSIINDLKSYIQDENFKDFKIEIDSREFLVHKFLLAARSPTLAEIFRSNPDAGNLKLVDISVEVFEVILNFLYTDENPRDDGTNFMHLFAAASRLKIKELINIAAAKVLDKICTENAVEVLELGNKYAHDGLRQKAFKEIKKNYPKVKFNDDMVMDTEKVKKMIEYFKEMQALEKKFSSLMD